MDSPRPRVRELLVAKRARRPSPATLRTVRGLGAIPSGLAFVGLEQWGWKLLLGAHLVAVIVAFGPLFVYPLLVRLAGHRSAVEQAAVVEAVKAVRRQVSEPAFLLVGPLGIATAASHPDQDIFGRAWVQWAIPLWGFAACVVWFVQRPLSRRVALLAGVLVTVTDNAADARLAARQLRRATTWLTRVTWVSWAGLLLMLWLMIAQPG